MPDTPFDLASELGANEAFALQKFTIYFPNKDRDNRLVPNVETYIEAGMWLMADINRGVTRLPASQGIWFDTNQPVPSELDVSNFEDTVLIFSYLMDPDSFRSRVREIRAFLHKFGRETNQGEVMVEYSGEKKESEGGLFVRAYSIKFPRIDQA